MTTRRSFLAAIAATLALDPARALWVPGKKLISIPRVKPILDLGDLFIIAGLPGVFEVTRVGDPRTALGTMSRMVSPRPCRRYGNFMMVLPPNV